AYTKVNQIFADTTLCAIRKVNSDRLSFPESQRPPSPIVWLHDYHLMEAANIIRDTCIDEGIEVRMAFFLHIPFPTYDILRICPWADEILMGVLGEYCLVYVI
ncbi:Alpha_alphatrehalosephosphate synthase A-like, partial [Caligus rogercresseyi]